MLVSDLDKVRRDLYRPRVRPTARTGLLLLKYLKTTYRGELGHQTNTERERRWGRLKVLQQQRDFTELAWLAHPPVCAAPAGP